MGLFISLSVGPCWTTQQHSILPCQMLQLLCTQWWDGTGYIPVSPSCPSSGLPSCVPAFSGSALVWHYPSRPILLRVGMCWSRESSVTWCAEPELPWCCASSTCWSNIVTTTEYIHITQAYKIWCHLLVKYHHYLFRGSISELVKHLETFKW